MPSKSERLLQILTSQGAINLEQQQQVQSKNLSFNELSAYVMNHFEVTEGQLLLALVGQMDIPDAEAYMARPEANLACVSMESKVGIAMPLFILPMELEGIDVRNSLERKTAAELVRQHPPSQHKSQDAIEQRIAASPGNLALYYVKAHALIHHGRYQEALDCLNHFQVKALDNPAIACLQAWLYYQLGNSNRCYQSLMPLYVANIPLDDEWLVLLACSAFIAQDWPISKKILPSIAAKPGYLADAAQSILAKIP